MLNLVKTPVNFVLNLLFLAIFSIYPSVIFAETQEKIIDIYIRDHKFEPAILEVPSGQKIRLVIHNEDPTIEEFESVQLKREKIILGNSTASVILAPLKPGEYKFFGEFHEDTAQGVLIVR